MTKKLLLTFALAIILNGCHVLSSKQPQETLATKNQAPEKEEIRPFTKDSLSALLTAEFAEQRGDFEKTLTLYTDQSKKTNDPKVAERAYQIAVYLNNKAARLDTAMLWAKISPHNLEANQSAFSELVENNNTQEASTFIETILKQTNNLDFLSIENQSLPAQSTAQLISTIDSLLIKYPNNNQLNYSKAILLSKEGSTQDALDSLNKLPSNTQKQTEVILFKTYLLQKTGQSSKAIMLLNKEVKNTPQNKQLRLTLAHRLIREGNLQEAKQQFLAINKQYPDDDEVRFAIALICLETQQWDEAINYLNVLLKNGVDPNIVYFYLGSAYENKGDKHKAFEFYRQINNGENLLYAIIRGASILFDQKNNDEAQQFLNNARQTHPDLSTALYLFEIQTLQDQNKLPQALKLIKKAINADPKNTSFYYARALLFEKDNNLTQAEKDLRYVIKLEPNNSSAINALGYILADRTTRYKEALQLIKQALSLSPDDPSTLDSMGWVNYKLGKLTQAQAYLQQAYDQYPDADIASHLGEVLWQLGDQTKAKAIWSKALAENPTNTLLLETIKRLTGSKEL